MNSRTQNQPLFASLGTTSTQPTRAVGSIDDLRVRWLKDEVEYANRNARERLFKQLDAQKKTREAERKVRDAERRARRAESDAQRAHSRAADADVRIVRAERVAATTQRHNWLLMNVVGLYVFLSIALIFFTAIGGNLSAFKE